MRRWASPGHPAAQPLVDYLANRRTVTMTAGHTGAEWQPVPEFVRAEAEGEVAQAGHLGVSNVTEAVASEKGS